MEKRNIYVTGLTALELNGLTFTNNKTLFTVTSIKELNNLITPFNTLIYDKEYDKKNYIEYNRQLRLYLPTEERSIVDAIRQGSVEDEHIYEAIDSINNIELLLKLARFYNTADKVKHYVDTLDEWMENFYNH